MGQERNLYKYYSKIMAWNKTQWAKAREKQTQADNAWAYFRALRFWNIDSQWCMPLLWALGRQRQINLCKFEASLVYRASSRTARTFTQRNPVLKTKKIWNTCTDFTSWTALTAKPQLKSKIWTILISLGAHKELQIWEYCFSLVYLGYRSSIKYL